MKKLESLFIKDMVASFRNFAFCGKKQEAEEAKEAEEAEEGKEQGKVEESEEA